MKNPIVKLSWLRLSPVQRAGVFIVLCAAALVAAVPARAQISPESDKLLHRLFDSSDFKVKTFGPARWLNGGEFYTTVEPSAAVHRKRCKRCRQLRNRHRQARSTHLRFATDSARRTIAPLAR